MYVSPNIGYRSAPLQSPPPHAQRATAAAGAPSTATVESTISPPQPPARTLWLHATVATEEHFGNPSGRQPLQPPARSHATAAAEDLTQFIIIHDGLYHLYG